MPLKAPPLIREHRLYQADWLIRFYGFSHDEIVPGSALEDTAADAGRHSGMLSLDIDPKLAWALAHRAQFPVDINRAPREMLLRVPGLGVKAVTRILLARRVRDVRADDLLRLHVPLKKVLPFVLLPDHHPGTVLDSAHLAAQLTPSPVQAGLFDDAPPALSALAVPLVLTALPQAGPSRLPHLPAIPAIPALPVAATATVPAALPVNILNRELAWA